MSRTLTEKKTAATARPRAKTKTRVCAVTGARSEYGLMRWLMQDLADDTAVDFKLIVTGSHWSKEFGSTYKEIEKDGFRIDARIEADFDPSSAVSLAEAVGAWTQQFAKTLAAMKPDLVLIMGDRYELLAVCGACVLLSIPIAHISGGEITEGASDEQIRHAVTKMAHLHFAANELYADHIRQMGEESWRICVSGEPGLDALSRLSLLSKKELEKDLEIDLSKTTALVTFHPETRGDRPSLEQLNDLLDALRKADLQCIITYPNADLGSREMIEALRRFQEKSPRTVKLLQNLGQKRYLSLLKTADLMIGNSSSGLVEAPSFNLPVVNIGDRQKGRLRATNIIDVPCDVESILSGLHKAQAYDRSSVCGNPYGNGQASTRIRAFIADAFSHKTREQLLRKRFVALPGPKAHIGGSFEIDLNTLRASPRQDWEQYLGLEKNSLLLASGRSAFRFILNDLALGKKTVLIPEYLCGEAQVPVLKEMGIAYRYYPVLPNLQADRKALFAALTPGVGAVVLINYFGLTDTRALSGEIRARQSGVCLIQDDAQALYELHYVPVEEQWADYVFASFIKFAGIPDGACVRSRQPLRNSAIRPAASSQGVSYLQAALLRAQFIAGQIPADEEDRTESSYVALFDKAARGVPTDVVAMTTFSRELLSRFPFEQWASRRRENFAYLAEALDSSRLVSPVFTGALNARQVPLAYPVRITNDKRDRLRAFLRAQNIFCPVHWPLIPELQTADHLPVQELTRTLLSLPVDQRYTPVALERMVDAIHEFERTSG